MAQLKCTHPVQWPSHSVRTPRWDRSINPSFKPGMTMAEAVGFIREEVQAMTVGNFTLTTDMENLDNLRVMRAMGNDSGAVLRISLEGRYYDLACDRWVQLEHNIYALSLALLSMRSSIGWGVGNWHQLLGGFGANGYSQQASTATASATPNAANGNGAAAELEEWRSLLGLGPTATLDDAHATYRRRAKSAMNDQDELMRLNLAMEAAQKILGT